MLRIAFAVMLLCCSVLSAQPVAELTTQPISKQPTLQGELKAFEPFLGVWEINDVWAWGSTVHAIAEYKAVLDGHAVEMRTWVSDDGKPLYERYRALLRIDDGKFAVHTLSHDGSLTKSQYTRDADSFVTSWEQGGTSVTDSISLIDPNSIRWLVKMTNADSGEKSVAMDGQWKRHKDEDLETMLNGWNPPKLAGAFDPISASIGIYGFDGGLVGSEIAVEPGPAGLSVVRKDSGYSCLSNYEAITYYSSSPFSMELFSSDGFTIGGSLHLERESEQRTALVHEWRIGSYRRLERILARSESGLTRSIQEWDSQKEAWNEPDTLHFSPLETVLSETIVQPIDPSLFDASGHDLRSFTKTRTIRASAADVFAAWTTADGWARVYSEPSKAEIDLAIGGQYHWLFDGTTGSNGCQILSYIPDRMVSFTWNAPPSQPESRARRTWVVVEMSPVDGDESACEVRLTHLGFGTEPHWDETYGYFDAAWGHILDRMAERLSK